MSTLEEQFQKLEQAHGNNWCMYFNSTGQYVIQLDKGYPDCRTFGPSNDLKQLATEAADWLFLPVYRPIPDLPPARERFVVTKYGDSPLWTILLDNKFFSCGFPTERIAEGAVDHYIESAKRARERWSETIGPLIAGKTEGVDFRFG